MGKHIHTVCTVPGCGRAHCSRGWCELHYKRWQKHGDPLKVAHPARPEQERFWEKVQKTEGCWLWQGSRDKNGYGRFAVGMKRDGNHEGKLAHRVAWMYEHGKMPALNLLHRCDNPQCVRPSHMFVGTQLDNMRDAKAKGRIARGERAGHAKLTEDDVRAIRQRRSTGETQREIAAAYGVARPLISMIEHGKRWAHAHV